MIRRARIVALAFTAGQLFSCNQILGISERGLDPHLSCDGGGCACVAGFADCDGNENNGCEADLSSTTSCGGCGRRCDNGQCAQGLCACGDGYGDCNGRAADGCEAMLDADPRNCGACGHDCLGGACVSRRCQPAAIVPLGTYNRGVLVPHGDHVYLSSWTDPRIARIPVAGGAAEVLVHGLVHLGPLALAPDTLYWPAGIALFSLPVTQTTGGASPKIVVDQAKAYVTMSTAAFAVGGGYAYWQEETPAIPSSLSRVSLTSGLIERGLWEGKTFLINQMVTDDSNLYFCDGFSLFALAHGGGTVVNFGDFSPVGGFAVHGANIFYTDFSNEYILRIPTKGGASVMLAASPQPGAVAADGEAVYWIDPVNGAVVRFVLGSSAIETVATGQDFAEALPTPTPMLNRQTIMVDDKAIYWSTQTRFMKLAK